MVITGGDEANPEILEQIRFDRPYHVQLGNWFWNMLRGDLGTSIFSEREITELILPRVQPTLSLGIQVTVISSILGVSTGMLLAWHSGSGPDRTLMFFAVLGFATPGFWLAFIMTWAFAVNVGWLPVLGYSPQGDGMLKHLRSMFLPEPLDFLSPVTRRQFERAECSDECLLRYSAGRPDSTWKFAIRAFRLYIYLRKNSAWVHRIIRDRARVLRDRCSILPSVIGSMRSIERTRNGS